MNCKSVLPEIKDRPQAYEVDKYSFLYYKKCMKKVVSILAMVLLALFAMSVMTHTAMATSMSLEMTFGVDGINDMADCEDCRPGSKHNKSGTNCDIICVTPLATAANLDQIFIPRKTTAVLTFAVQQLSEHSWSPEPFPPRSFTLNS